jgi:hypothetical protein
MDQDGGRGNHFYGASAGVCVRLPLRAGGARRCGEMKIVDNEHFAPDFV